MNETTLLKDARLRPELFRWNGKPDAEKFQKWRASSQWLARCPEDLFDFWERTGGGDLFETETILGPFGNRELGDDIALVNREMRSRGMPEIFIVFAVGVALSAVDTSEREYVVLDVAGFRVLRRFKSFDSWYRGTLRHEFGERYRLP